MSTLHTGRLLTVGILACAFSGMTDRHVSAQAILETHHHRDTEMGVVAVGCLQREKDYRKSIGRHNGPGNGDEYILTNAVIGIEGMPVQAVPEDQATCVSTPDGQSFELSGPGPGEDGIRDAGDAQFLGHRVVITGRLKHAKHDIEMVGTNGVTGEFTPLSTKGGWVPGDLKLREINVDSFALAPVLAPALVVEETPAPAPAPAPEYTPAPAPAPAPEYTPAPAPEPKLPKTASPLPLIGLFGLLSLLGGFGLRAFERRSANLL